MIDAYGETYRYQCEVRAIIKDRVRMGSQWAHEHIDGIAKKRGRHAADMLLREIRQQWEAGNRGDKGDWR